MANKTNKLTYVVEINDKGKIKIDNLTKSFVNADNAVNKLTADLKKQQTAMAGVTKDGLNPMIDKTGLAGATVVELGRTISDSNYGIRGMANNLSQLSTLMITLISTTGGLKKGLTALLNVVKGPLGFILAFQLVITLLERFDMQSSKTKESIDGIATASASAGSDLKILRDVMDDSTLSTEELERAVDKANLQYKDLNIQIGENGRVTEESRKQIDDKILSLERLAKALAVQKEIERVFGEITKSQVEEEKSLQAEENKRSQLEAERIQARNRALTGAAGTMGEATETIIQRNKEAVRERFKEQREELFKELDILTGILTKENLVDELFNPPKTGAKGLPKRAKERLLEFSAELNNFFLDVDKEGVEGVLVRGVERVKNIYKPLFETAKEGLIPLAELGREYNEVLKRSEDSLKAGLKFIKNQAKDVSNLFKETQKALGYVNTVIMSYHNARMEALARERDYALHSGKLTGDAQIKALADIEKRERKAQERKIKTERDLFTIKQSLLIAEEIMKFKFEIAARKRQLTDKVTEITAEGITQVGKAQMSAGAFAAQGGPLGLATFAITIGGLIASILAARKKAQAALSQLGSPSSGGGGAGLSVEAPDFNVVGASPESQLAQSISGQQEKPLRAFVVNKDIKDAQELDRTIDFNRSLG
ncbi:MAG: hypothetical protein WBH49_03370 [Flavobacteriaceae bacterium]